MGYCQKLEWPYICIFLNSMKRPFFFNFMKRTELRMCWVAIFRMYDENRTREKDRHPYKGHGVLRWQRWKFQSSHGKHGGALWFRLDCSSRINALTGPRYFSAKGSTNRRRFGSVQQKGKLHSLLPRRVAKPGEWKSVFVPEPRWGAGGWGLVVN